jgi:hypothetical protein
MPLESSWHCGYALSILDHHCRHCPSAPPAGPSVHFDAKYLPHNILLAIPAINFRLDGGDF